jgi:hypothetical protein
MKTIKIPINKNYFTTFLNSYLPIKYFNDDRVTLEELKNLLFPVEYSDSEFDELVEFISQICDELIRFTKDLNAIKTEISKKVIFLKKSSNLRMKFFIQFVGL